MFIKGFSTLILLILRLILVFCLNMRLSVVLMMNAFFLIFLRQMPKVIHRRRSLPCFPPPKYNQHWANLQCTSKNKF